MPVRISVAVGGSTTAPDDRVLVAVADGGEVNMIAGPTAGHRDGEQLPRFPCRDDGVGGVGGDPLRSVDGGGVAELDVITDVLGGQDDLASGRQMRDSERAGPANTVDAPAVAVLHPISAADGQLAIVASADDVPTTGGIAVPERNLPPD